jgi:hypothetical protein
VQQYIHTGPKPSEWRVLTLFGEPLYCLKSTSRDGEIDLSAPDGILETTGLVAPTGAYRLRDLTKDPEVLDLARRVHAACPDVPLKGIDMVREEKSGKLYVLEFNPGGNTWHFSSPAGHRTRVQVGDLFTAKPEEREEAGRLALVQQFDVFVRPRACWSTRHGRKRCRHRRLRPRS